MPVQQIVLTDREQQAVARVAEQLGMSVEDAVSLLAKESLARRMTPHPNGKVIPWPGRRSA